jgi:hypothetical protein
LINNTFQALRTMQLWFQLHFSVTNLKIAEGTGDD